MQGLEDINKTLRYIDEDMQNKFLVLTTKDAYKSVKKRAEVHHDTGNMENNITYRVRKKELYGEVYIEDHNMLTSDNINYALFVLFGTKPHAIKPKDKKTLRYSGVHGFVDSKRVHHPGYKGDNFLKKGVEDTFSRLDSIFKKV